MDPGPDIQRGAGTCLGDLPRGHTAHVVSRWQSQDLNQGCLAPQYTLSIIQTACRLHVPARAACGRQEDRHKKERKYHTEGEKPSKVSSKDLSPWS